MIENEEIKRHVNSLANHPRWDVTSEEIMQSTYLQKVGIVEENEWIVKLRGICLQVSSPGSDPHVITILIKKPLPGKIQHATCSCAGGKSGKCKHATAVLKYASINENLEPWTCTTGTCIWDKKELKKVQEDVLKPIPLQNFCHHIRHKENRSSEIPHFFESDFFKEFAENLPQNCAYVKFMKGRGTLKNVMMPALTDEPVPPEFPRMLNTLYKVSFWNSTIKELVDTGKALDFSLSQDDITNIEETTRDQSKNPNWFNYRIGRITGCVIGTVMKARSFTSNIDVLKKICQRRNKLDTPALRYGRLHEKDGLELYKRCFEDHVNLKVEEAGLFIHPKYPWLAASPDALVSCDCCGKRLVEIKCPYNCSVESGKKMSIADLQWMPLTRNSDYYYQMQLQMFILGLEHCDFVVWAEKEYLIERYHRDIDVCHAIVERSTEYFYHAVVPELLAKVHTRQNREREKKKRKTPSGA